MLVGRWVGHLTAVVFLGTFGASAQTLSAATDNEIQSAFVGMAAFPTEGLPVSTGPFEFASDGRFFHQQDRGRLDGTYVISAGKICINYWSGTRAFCFEVYRKNGQFFLRSDAPPVPEGGRPAFLVTLRPLLQ